MCKKIRERFPRLKIVVGIWGFTSVMQTATVRFERTQRDRLSTTLAEAIEHIQDLVPTGV
jgi:hypothetical protein